jgi:hypothetical protein
LRVYKINLLRAHVALQDTVYRRVANQNCMCDAASAMVKCHPSLSDNTKKAQSSYSAYTYLLIAAGI